MRDGAQEEPAVSSPIDVPPVPSLGGSLERLSHGVLTADMEVVRSEVEIEQLQDLLFGERNMAVVVLTQSEETLQPVLPPQEVRTIVGPGAALYYVPGERLLRRLAKALGRPLAVYRGTARVFWPALRSDSDPGDHPLMVILDGEHEQDALTEFARQFDLSRPHVRREVRLIEDARSFLQEVVDVAGDELLTAAERLRDAHIERHEAVVRAERAEGAETGKE
jgi:hypothetical protein